MKAKRIRLVVGKTATAHGDNIEVGEGDFFPASGWTIERNVNESPVLTIRIPMVFVDVEWPDPKNGAK